MTAEKVYQKILDHVTAAHRRYDYPARTAEIQKEIIIAAIAEALDLCAQPRDEALRAAREALERNKEIVCGDRNPRWAEDYAITNARRLIADVCDAALEKIQQLDLAENHDRSEVAR